MVAASRSFRNMRDWSLPGYKYLGPGNKLNKGRPRNRNDAVAYVHDVAYDKYIKAGKNPYTQYNDADETARKQFGLEDYGGAAGKTFFQLKKLAWQTGLTGHLEKPGKKRLRGHTPPHIEPARKKLAHPRLRGSLPNSTRDTPVNPPSSTATGMDGAGDGQGSGNNLGLKETPVDDPYNVHRGPPDYTFASLPFVETKRIALDGTYAIDHVYRLTSPYDPSVTINGPTDFNPTTATTNVYTAPGGADANIVKARWFDFYGSMYSYYHVISTRYTVYIENFGSEPIYAHVMMYNNDLPNQGATNDDMMLWPNVRTQVLTSPFNAINAFGSVQTAQANPSANVNIVIDENDAPTSGGWNYQSGNHVTSRGGHISTSFSGEYRPGDFKREINLDSEVENWTLVSSNPALSERLLVRIKPENPGIGTSAGTYGDSLNYKIAVKFDYLVEFKELKPSLRYPVQEQPLLATIQSDPFQPT